MPPPKGNPEGPLKALLFDSWFDVYRGVLVLIRVIDGEIHYYFFGTYYLPSQAIEDGRNAQYYGWRELGLLTETEGDVIDR